MAQTVQDFMTPSPRTLDARTSIQEAAQVMRDEDIGDVLVTEAGAIAGIVTDRDISVRAVAEAKAPKETAIGEIASRDLVSVSPADSLDEVIAMMRDKAIRRIPVVDGNRPVGILSLGDLAMARDPQSVLADVSAAPANN
jgi:CBS domain-containing protein